MRQFLFLILILTISFGFAQEEDSKFVKRLKSQDTDQDGLLSLEEYLTFKNKTLEGKAAKKREKSFNRLDQNEDGFIDLETETSPKKKERKKVKEMSEEDKLYLFSVYDQDDNGAISQEEFLSKNPYQAFLDMREAKRVAARMIKQQERAAAKAKRAEERAAARAARKKKKEEEK